MRGITITNNGTLLSSNVTIINSNTQTHFASGANSEIVTLSLAASGVVAGTYNTIVVNTYGIVTNASNTTGFLSLSGGTLTGALTGTTASFSGAVTTGSLIATAINSTPIGATTPSTGAFTSLTNTGTFHSSGAASFSALTNFFPGTTPNTGIYSGNGLSIGWNLATGQGEVDFFLGPQGGPGGLNMYQLTSAGSFSPTTPIFALSSGGSLNVPGPIQGGSSVFAYNSAGGEADCGASLAGYNSAYIYNNSTAWGLFSTSGGAIINYTRSSGAIAIGGPVTVGAAAAASQAVQWQQVLGGNNAVWYNVAPSRAVSTTYTNSHGKPIYVSVNMIPAGGPAALIFNVNSVQICNMAVDYNVNSNWSAVSAIVPAGATYSVAGGGPAAIGTWWELY